MFGRVFQQLVSRYSQGMEVSLAVVTDLSEEEMSHVAGLCHKHQGPVNESAFSDCVRIVKDSGDKKVSSDDDLLALRNKLKERKGANT